MTANISLGQYLPGSSVVHRLDPRTKIFLMALYIAIVFVVKSLLVFLLPVVLLVAMFVMILGNFQLMLGQTEPDATTFILPGLIIAALAAGIVWALVLRETKPSIYRQIGHGTEPGAYGTEMLDVVDSQ